MKEESLSRSELELDYLKFKGELRKFDARNPKHRQSVNDYLQAAGLEKKKEGDDWVFYHNEEMGIKAYFSNYPIKGIISTKRPSLTLEFTGHFFIRENAYESSKKMVRFFANKFGTYFKINRVDIRQDIYGAYNPFDYFPNFKDDRKLCWATRSKPTINYYINDGGHEFTGFAVVSSRYRIKSYNRNLLMRDAFRKGKMTSTYYKHYKSIYKNRKVQRLEIQLVQDACSLFSILYFSGEKTKEDTLKYVMANFGRNHTLKRVTPGMAKESWPIDSVFSELFYLDHKNDVKLFKMEFSRKASLKFSDMTFSYEGKSINEIVKMLAKKICEHSEGDNETRDDLLTSTVQILRRKTTEFKDILNDKFENCRKTLDFMYFDLLEIAEQQAPMKYSIKYG